MPTINADLEAFHKYMAARTTFLTTVNCTTSCRDPLAEFSEWLVAELLSATLATSRVQKGFDVVRPDGRQVQVKYLANPSSKWINEHHVKFPDETHEYALVIFEEFDLSAVLIFNRKTIGDVCTQLGKRHPRQDQELQFTRRNFLAILDQPETFERLGVFVYLP